MLRQMFSIIKIINKHYESKIEKKIKTPKRRSAENAGIAPSSLVSLYVYFDFTYILTFVVSVPLCSYSTYDLI